MKVAAFLDSWLQRKRGMGNTRENTLLTYEWAVRILNNRLGTLDLVSLTKQKVEDAYISMRQDRKSPRSISLIHSVLNSALDDAIDNALIPTNPAARAQHPKIAKPSSSDSPRLPEDDLKKLLAAAVFDDRGILVRFALGTGCRRGEIAALDWSDIDFTAQTVTISKTLVQNGSFLKMGPPKSEAGKRTLMLPKTLLGELWGVYSMATNKTGPVFTTQTGSRLRPVVISDHVTRIMREAGVTGYSIHDLRHTHISVLLSSGVPLPAVARRAGHADVRTTMGVYAHAAPSEDSLCASQIEKAMI